MTDPQPIWGQHLIIDLAGCPRERLSDPVHLRAWIAELVETIDMKAYGEPQVEHFAAHTYDAAGYTLLQLIETSNICAHFAENLGQAYIDIFSCKRFDESDAVALCRAYFEPEIIEQHSLERGRFKVPVRRAS